MRARLEGTADALPPREDDRDRRPRRLRRRHRSDLGVRRPLRLERTTRRAASVGWHDACARIEGPGGRRCRRAFPHALARGDRRDARRRSLRRTTAGDVEVQIVRTVPEHIYDGDAEGRLRHSRVVPARAQGRRSGSSTSRTSSSGRPRSQAVLQRQAREPARPRLPASCSSCPPSPTPAPTTRAACSASLIEADDDAGRVLACTLYARCGQLADPVYVHAKIAIVDDEWLTLGSANLNEHSLFNDTEMNVVTHDPELAARHALRLWAEHLELPVERDPGRPDRGDRRALEADQQGAARPARRAAGRSPTGSCGSRTSRSRSGRALGPLQRPPRRRLSSAAVARGRSRARAPLARAARQSSLPDGYRVELIES